MKKILTALIAVLALCLCTLNGAIASAAGRAILLSPMSQKIILIPGETYRGGVTVGNPANATNDLNYIVSIGAYSTRKGEGSRDDYGDFSLVDKTNQNIMMDWIQIDEPTGSLRPNEQKIITFSINVPADAPAGGQYASLLVKENSDSKAKEGNTGVHEIMQMGHIIYAEVAGETKQEGKITSNNIPSFVLSNVLEANSEVRNNGNVHTDAEYTLQVWPLFSNEEICTNEENAATSLVMPNTTKYHVESCNVPSVGIFKAKQTVKIFGEVSTSEKMVIVCPAWLLVMIIIAIVVIAAWLYSKSKARKKSKK